MVDRLYESQCRLGKAPGLVHKLERLMANNKYPVIVESTGASTSPALPGQDVKAVNRVALGFYAKKARTLCGKGLLARCGVYHHCTNIGMSFKPQLYLGPYNCDLSKLTRLSTAEVPRTWRFGVVPTGC